MRPPDRIRCLAHPPKEHPRRRDAGSRSAFAPASRGARGRSRLFLAAVAAALFCAQAAPADETRLRGPGKKLRTGVEAEAPARGKPNLPAEIVAAPVLFYQRFLRPHWGQQCAYHPSCSNYALQAIRRHGALVGAMLTFDRLQHEADEGRTSPPILVGGQIKIYDPLENNAYWWYRMPSSAPAPPANAD